MLAVISEVHPTLIFRVEDIFTRSMEVVHSSETSMNITGSHHVTHEKILSVVVTGFMELVHSANHNFIIINVTEYPSSR
jgi:hypothetical protein